jgi:hypothetical protein
MTHCSYNSRVYLYHFSWQGKKTRILKNRSIRQRSMARPTIEQLIRFFMPGYQLSTLNGRSPFSCYRARLDRPIKPEVQCQRPDRARSFLLILPRWIESFSQVTGRPQSKQPVASPIGLQANAVGLRSNDRAEQRCGVRENGSVSSVWYFGGA